ncbi:glycosyltransferase family 4 protein [Microbacterium sp. OR16]|uniref:glycosyltransferase family 4 protein n=1 Tax=Microbacterium sp. OR16 TaxID=3095345 RepID=UPI0039B3BA18
MRIVYLHQYFNTPEQHGSTRSYEFARRLAARGHDVHIVTSERGERTSGKWSTTAVEGFTVHWRHVPYSNDMSAASRLKAFATFAMAAAGQARRLRGDVVFATSTPLTIFVPAWYAVAFRRTPLVFEIRDSWPSVPIALGYLRNPVAQFLARCLERKAYRRSAHIIALSPGMKEEACLHGARPDRVTVIPNAADVGLFDVDQSAGVAWRDSHEIARDVPLVVYAGTLGAANEVEYLVNVAAEARSLNPQVVFAIMGTGAREENIRDLAARKGLLNTTVRLMRPVPKNEIPAFFSAADITTSVVTDNAAMNANSANKFFDSLAAGRSIAINHGGWQAELIQERGVGLVLDRHDYSAAARQLVEFVEDSSRLLEAGQQALALAKSQFSRDDLAARLADVLESVSSSRDNRLTG